MFIKSIHVKKFKGIDDLRVHFPSDITVVKGPNERGKSTLLEAFTVTLFADPTRSREGFEDFRSWESPDSLFLLELLFEHEGETYELTKDFEKKTISLINREKGIRYDSFKEIQEILAALGGYRNPVLFENSAFVREESIEIASKGKKAIDSTLEEMLSGGARQKSVSEVVKKVEHALDELSRGLGPHPVKNLGRIAYLKREIERVEGEIEKALHGRERLEEATKKLEMLKSKLEKTTEERDLATGELEEALRLSRYLEEKEKAAHELDELEGRIKTIETIEGNIVELKAERTRLGLSQAYNKEDVEGAIEHVKRLRHELLILEKEVEHLGESLMRTAMLPHPMVFFLLSLLMLLGFGGFVFSRFLFLSWVVLAGVAGGIMTTRMAKRGIHAGEAKRRKTLKEKKGAHAALKSELRGEMQRFGVTKIEELEKLSSTLRRFEEDERALIHKRDVALGEKSMGALKERKKGILRTLALEEEKLSIHGGIGEKPTSRAIHRLENRRDELSHACEILRGDIGGAEVLTKELAAAYSVHVALEEMGSQLKREFTGAEREAETLRILKEYLLRAKRLSFEHVRASLAKGLGDMLYELTSARYSKVEIGEDLTFTVFSDEKGEQVKPDEHLSRGTIDQFYLAARFAVLKVLSGSEKEEKPVHIRPLIILDDPFGSFDSERRSNARVLLEKLSKDFQIVLLTHSDLYDDWGTVVTM